MRLAGAHAENPAGTRSEDVVRGVTVSRKLPWRSTGGESCGLPSSAAQGRTWAKERRVRRMLERKQWATPGSGLQTQAPNRGHALPGTLHQVAKDGTYVREKT
jgi:hypothetical protein